MSLHSHDDASATGSAAARRWWPLWLACPLLAGAALLTRREVYSLLTLALFVTLVMLPALTRQRARPWLVWLGLQLILLLVASRGASGVVLEAVPVAVNAALAWLFARTLGRPRPLIACCIVAVDGEARLQVPGVARYARQLTLLWASLLAANALLLAGLLLASFFTVLPHPAQGPGVAAWWASAWLHVGGYVLPGLVLVLEYAYRRWRWRHLRHVSLSHMLWQLAAQWPRLLRDRGATG